LDFDVCKAGLLDPLCVSNLNPNTISYHIWSSHSISPSSSIQSI